MDENKYAFVMSGDDNNNDQVDNMKRCDSFESHQNIQNDIMCVRDRARIILKPNVNRQ